MYLLQKKTILLLIFMSVFTFAKAQKKPYEVPTLENQKKATSLKLSEDFQNKKIKSSYMKGFTEKDTLYIKVHGTYTLQHVMISVIAKNKEDIIDVGIVKKDWKDVKRKGKTRNGLYQESFETARNFGITIYSKKPNTPFDLIVWTSGEIIPKTKSIYYPSSQFKNSNTYHNNTSNGNNSTNNSKTEQKSNMLMYVIIGVLGIITILLLMILKKKKSATIILFLLSYSVANAGIIPGNPSEMMEQANKVHNMRQRFNEFVKKDEHGNSTYDYLAGSDKEYVPNLDAKGQPKLPSSCFDADSKHLDNQPNTTENNQPTNSPSNGNREDDTKYEDTKYEDNKYDDTKYEDKKYDTNGNAISSQNNTNTPNNQVMDDYTTVGVGDGLRKDKDGNPIVEEDTNTSNNQVMDDYATVGVGDGLRKDENGNPIIENTTTTNATNENPFVDNIMIVVHGTDHPKYDKDGKVINYDTSNRPKYDKNGIAIKYASENDDTNYNRYGMPKYDKDNKPIYYDDLKRPKYDKYGKEINYKNETEYDGDKPINVAGNTVRTKGEVTNNTRNYDNKSSESNRNNSSQRSTRNNTAESSITNNNRKSNKNQKNDACDCLENAYDNLDILRFKFEKLRIIYNDTKKVVDWSISFGDDVSGIHAISGMAWQREKQKILKNMDNFYKSYDSKHNEFAVRLNEILHEIDRCESKLGFKDWYNKVGFIYYNFMNDKYKRN